MSVNIGFLVPALCGAGWAVAASRGAREGPVRAGARGLVGGAVAFAAAWGGYALLDAVGLRVTWAELAGGGAGSVVAAAAIGLVEEGAKLAGLSLASLHARTLDPASVARRVLLVCAAFSSFECAFTLGEVGGPVLLLRALLGPVAHASLAVPLGLALVGGGRRLRWVPPALLASATLHGASDLALALPGPGRLGFAAALAAPVVALHLAARGARAGWARRPTSAG